MPRETKYRAWLKDNKRFKKGMHDWESIKDTVDLENGWRKSILAFGCDMENENVILMQYLNAKDENGIEIYEGDIIEFEHTDLTGTSILTGLVYWCEKTWTVKVKYKGWKIPQHFYHDGICKVIGNKYQNPELLK